MLVGDIMRQLFVLREDGTVDIDMLAAHLRAEEIHGKLTGNLRTFSLE